MFRSVSCFEVKTNRLGLVTPAFNAGAASFRFHCLELYPGLLPVSYGVVSAKWNLLVTRKQKFLAAFHQVLLVEGPWIHKVLQHDHDHVTGDIANREAFRNPAGLA